MGTTNLTSLLGSYATTLTTSTASATAMMNPYYQQQQMAQPFYHNGTSQDAFINALGYAGWDYDYPSVKSEVKKEVKRAVNKVMSFRDELREEINSWLN